MDKKVVKLLLGEDYDKRDALFYAHIHEVTQGGQRGAEAFVLQEGQSLDAILPPDDGTREAAFARIDVERLYTNSGFRKDYVDYYQLFVAPKIETGRSRSLASVAISFLRQRL